MKRILCLVLAAVMMLSLSACGLEDILEPLRSRFLRSSSSAPETDWAQPGEDYDAIPSPERAYEAAEEEYAPAPFDAGIGDHIFLGSWEQDNDFSDGTEAIEWIVLDRNPDGSLLVISRYCLDCKRFNDEYRFITWETCTLRSWLNGEFYETAFTEAERDRILLSTNVTEDNPNTGAEGGADTEDHVFALSVTEAYAYFEENERGSSTERATSPTAYAAAQGAEPHYSSGEFSGNCYWWLRTPGGSESEMYGALYITVVDYEGNILGDSRGHVGFNCHTVDIGVRPAMWIR